MLNDAMFDEYKNKLLNYRLSPSAANLEMLKATDLHASCNVEPSIFPCAKPY